MAGGEFLPSFTLYYKLLGNQSNQNSLPRDSFQCCVSLLYSVYRHSFVYTFFSLLGTGWKVLLP